MKYEFSPQETKWGPLIGTPAIVFSWLRG